jgi:plastocyanin
MKFIASASAFVFLFAGAAQAASISLDVRGPDGKPLSGAIVAVGIAGAEAPPVHGPYKMAQQNISFQPHVLIVPVGANVEFPNLDRVRHHVYSFSKAKKFDLKLYGQEEKRTVLFDKPGVVTLGCNIHDAMSGVIFVTASKFTAMTDANGHVAIPGVSPGKAVLTIWHPSIRGTDNVATQPLTVLPSGGASVITVGK